MVSVHSLDSLQRRPPTRSNRPTAVVANIRYKRIGGQYFTSVERIEFNMACVNVH